MVYTHMCDVYMRVWRSGGQQMFALSFSALFLDTGSLSELDPRQAAALRPRVLLSLPDSTGVIDACVVMRGSLPGSRD